jgi:hypothetical protein
LHPGAIIRSGAEKYVARLRVELAITDAQAEAWGAFAEALRENRRRMQTFDDAGDQPFGPVQDRLAALASMRRAAQDLLAVLERAQRRKAMQLLPLCCTLWAAAALGSRARLPVDIT